MLKLNKKSSVTNFYILFQFICITIKIYCYFLCFSFGLFYFHTILMLTEKQKNKNICSAIINCAVSCQIDEVVFLI